MPSKSGRNILECYIRNVKPPSCAKLVLLCKFACKSAADNLHSKTKAEPLAEFSASVSTYLQGNSRVDEPFRMEDKTRAIITGAGEGGTRETLALPRGEAASVLSDFPTPVLLPITPQVSSTEASHERPRTLSD